MYLKAAKSLKPVMTREASETIERFWVELRQRDLEVVG